ncbi:unnamed protein product [Blepharisma stoltei]|uniref:Tetratricopeptide repeat protein 29 n=1 Tax=Blepharisma stoltei TaxID=1481888 RepID=A0AAU9K2B0_9CILI|nr:unnamed protein product [Blepharisma stoltei]
MRSQDWSRVIDKKEIVVINYADREMVEPKIYHTASTIHKAPPRLSPKKSSLFPHLDHTPISGIEGKMLLYNEVFIKSTSLPALASKKKPKKPKKIRKVKITKTPGFFHQLLSIPVDYPNPGETLQDLLMKSELGIPPGDLQREAKMSLALGDKFESGNKILKATKFYRRLYFASEMNGDNEGKALALNRLGLVYYNKGRFKKAKDMNENHQQLCPDEFIPYYNLGIIYRSLKKHMLSIKKLEQAVDMSVEINDIEGECIALAQLGFSYKAYEDLDKAKQNLNQALEKAIEIGTKDIELELKMALAYIFYHTEHSEDSEKYFHSAMLMSKGPLSDICRINVGILRAQKADIFNIKKPLIINKN